MNNTITNTNNIYGSLWYGKNINFPRFIYKKK